MARGWESKSVEDQIQERESETAETRPRLTPEQAQLQARRQGLQMVRTRTLMSLQSACDSRYRAHLERVLADVDAKLIALAADEKPQA
jgi:uncharacterized membrane protein